MINRLRPYLDADPEPTPPDDYYEVQTRCDTFFVTAEVAERVSEALGRWLPPRWIRFVDLSGATVRVRSRLVDCVRACLASQRAAAREFHRARRREHRENRRPWEDDEWW